MTRNADSEEMQAQYRGGCGADSIQATDLIPSEVPDEAYIWVDGTKAPVPANPRTAIPSEEPLRKVSVEEIIEYLSETLPKFATRLETEYLDELQQTTGESVAMLRQDLEFVKQLATPDSLRRWLTVADTDLASALQKWQSASEYDERAVPLGRGINVNAGHNVGAVVIPEIWRALTKNAVLHKMPGSDQLTLRVLAETYAENPHPVAESFAVGYWPGGAEELERNLYAADYVMAWGDDDTIASIRQRLAPTTRFIPFHFEFGTYLVDVHTQQTYDNELLQQIAADFSWGDQLLCFSPLLMVIERCDATEKFVSDLAEVLEEYADTYPRGIVPEDTEMKQTRARKIARDYGTLVSDWNAETTVVLEEGLEQSDLEEFHSFRYVEAHTVETLEPAIDLVGTNENLQEFIVAVEEKRGDDLRDQIALTNAKRITSPGGAAPTAPIPWDGQHPAMELVKWISDERANNGET